MFAGPNGIGLLAVGMPTIKFSAWPCAMDDLESAKHVHEVPRRERIHHKHRIRLAP
jgi:hypothetical protein